MVEEEEKEEEIILYSFTNRYFKNINFDELTIRRLLTIHNLFTIYNP